MGGWRLIHEHEIFMRAALDEAHLALEQDEVPVGAVVVFEERIIGRGHNQKEQLRDPTAHAEMLAITAASIAMGDWRLTDCTLYVTLEPCPMCAGAIVLSRMKCVVYGTDDPKFGGCGSLFSIVDDPRTNHQVEIISDVEGAACSRLLTDFFRAQRALGKK